MVRALEQRFKRFTLKHIPRSENVEADELAKAAANNLPMSEGTFYKVLRSLAIETRMKPFQIVLLTEFEDWRQAIVDSLNNVCTIKDEASEARMTTRARSYTMIDDTLYKKGVV
jgi:hypothetical protein